MNFTPLIQVVICGGLPTIRARSSFHWPWCQNVGHSASGIGNGHGDRHSLISVTIDVVGPVEKVKLRTCGLPPSPSP